MSDFEVPGTLITLHSTQPTDIMYGAKKTISVGRIVNDQDNIWIQVSQSFALDGSSSSAGLNLNRSEVLRLYRALGGWLSERGF